ncbi:MAG: hypothetical protein NXI20_11325 [bacterium]|nr:hypothetical protein [bacterium]
MKIRFSAILFVLVFCNCDTTSPAKTLPAGKLEEAHRLYFQMKPYQAYELYKQVLLDSSYSVEDRVEAGLNFSRMSWLMFGDVQQCYQTLTELESFNHNIDKIHVLWSRVLLAEKDFNGAISKSHSAINVAQSEKVKYEAHLALFKSILKKYGNSSRLEIDRSTELSEAYQLCEKLMLEQPGDIELSNLYLGLSLLLGDLEAAYKGWLSFFRSSNEEIHPTLENASVLLKKGIVEGDSVLNVKSVVLGLAQSGFKDYSVLLARRYHHHVDTTDFQLQDLFVYQRFLNNVGHFTLDFYKKTVQGEEDKAKYNSKFLEECKRLFTSLAWDGDPKPYNNKNFSNEVRQRFNLIYDFQNANGHYGLHLGHVVLDDTRMINHYGKSAKLRYIVIDHMKSNGYSSWFWDGAAEVGGWTSSDYFLQVRSAYNQGPVNAWLMVTDSVHVVKTKKDIIEKKALDDSIARKNPFSYLPGLDIRLSFKVRSQLLDSLRQEGYSGNELRLKFINTFESRVRNSSIYAHEGRHAIDDIYSGYMFASEDEFRAKLSEIYFADDPFHAFGSILAPNIGDDTSHGKANLKIIKKLVYWMNDHSNEIAGFDHSRPTLPQFDLLTKEQLKSAIRSFDPLAN